MTKTAYVPSRNFLIVLLIAATLGRILGLITITTLQCIYAYALTITPS